MASSGNWPPHLRQVRRSQEFDIQGSKIAGSAQRFDEAVASLEWSLARNPYKHDAIPGTAVRIGKTDPLGGVPPLRVYFTIEEDGNCNMIHVEEIPDENDEA
jgi:hypothetical protein